MTNNERPTLIDKLENQLKNNKRGHRTDPKLISEAIDEIKKLREQLNAIRPIANLDTAEMVRESLQKGRVVTEYGSVMYGHGADTIEKLMKEIKWRRKEMNDVQ
jgi:hypothetical protein